MAKLNSKDFRELGLEVADQMVRSKDGQTALINYKNWFKAQKIRFIRSMNENPKWKVEITKTRYGKN